MNNRPERSVLVLCALSLSLLSSLAFAGPTRCAEGFQDSSCLSAIASAAQTPQTCPASTATEMVVTQAPAVWEGSHYSAPVCAYYPEPATCEQQGYNASTPGTIIADPVWNATTDAWSAAQCSYTAAPTCPSGETQTTAAQWTGSGWIAPLCSDNASSTEPGAQETACASAFGIAQSDIDNGTVSESYSSAQVGSALMANVNSWVNGNYGIIEPGHYGGTGYVTCPGGVPNNDCQFADISNASKLYDFVVLSESTEDCVSGMLQVWSCGFPSGTSNLAYTVTMSYTIGGYSCGE